MEKWKEEKDAIDEAFWICKKRDRMSVFLARLIVRNAIDCFRRRRGKNKIKNPRALFLSRVRRGRDTLKKSGLRIDDRAAEIVKGWLESGELKK